MLFRKLVFFEFCRELARVEIREAKTAWLEYLEHTESVIVKDDGALVEYNPPAQVSRRFI